MFPWLRWGWLLLAFYVGGSAAGRVDEDEDIDAAVLQDLLHTVGDEGNADGPWAEAIANAEAAGSRMANFALRQGQAAREAVARGMAPAAPVAGQGVGEAASLAPLGANGLQGPSVATALEEMAKTTRKKTTATTTNEAAEGTTAEAETTKAAKTTTAAAETTKKVATTEAETTKAEKTTTAEAETTKAEKTTTEAETTKGEETTAEAETTKAEKTTTGAETTTAEETTAEAETTEAEKSATTEAETTKAEETTTAEAETTKSEEEATTTTAATTAAADATTAAGATETTAPAGKDEKKEGSVDLEEDGKKDAKDGKEAKRAGSVDLEKAAGASTTEASTTEATTTEAAATTTARKTSTTAAATSMTTPPTTTAAEASTTSATPPAKKSTTKAAAKKAPHTVPPVAHTVETADQGTFEQRLEETLQDPERLMGKKPEKTSVTATEAPVKAPALEGFDCEEDRQMAKEAWSEEKIDWCCATKGIACEAKPTATVPPAAPRQNATTKSTTTKPPLASVTTTTKSAPQQASKPKKHANASGNETGSGNKTAPGAEVWDCKAGADAWEYGWSTRKKEHCCEVHNVGCQSKLFAEVPPEHPKMQPEHDSTKLCLAGAWTEAFTLQMCMERCKDNNCTYFSLPIGVMATATGACHISNSINRAMHCEQDLYQQVMSPTGPSRFFKLRHDGCLGSPEQQRFTLQMCMDRCLMTDCRYFSFKEGVCKLSNMDLAPGQCHGEKIYMKAEHLIGLTIQDAQEKIKRDAAIEQKMGGIEADTEKKAHELIADANVAKWKAVAEARARQEPTHRAKETMATFQQKVAEAKEALADEGRAKQAAENEEKALADAKRKEQEFQSKLGGSSGSIDEAVAGMKQAVAKEEQLKADAKGDEEAAEKLAREAAKAIKDEQNFRHLGDEAKAKKGKAEATKAAADEAMDAKEHELQTLESQASAASMQVSKAEAALSEAVQKKAALAASRKKVEKRAKDASTPDEEMEKKLKDLKTTLTKEEKSVMEAETELQGAKKASGEAAGAAETASKKAETTKTTLTEAKTAVKKQEELILQLQKQLAESKKPPPMDCSADKDRWRSAWSERKKKHCCETSDVGCEEPLKIQNSTSEAEATTSTTAKKTTTEEESTTTKTSQATTMEETTTETTTEEPTTTKKTKTTKTTTTEATTETTTTEEETTTKKAAKKTTKKRTTFTTTSPEATTEVPTTTAATTEATTEATTAATTPAPATTAEATTEAPTTAEATTVAPTTEATTAAAATTPELTTTMVTTVSRTIGPVDATVAPPSGGALAARVAEAATAISKPAGKTGDGGTSQPAASADKGLTSLNADQCSGYSPTEGPYKGHGGSCGKWGKSSYWCFAEPAVVGPDIHLHQLEGVPGKYAAPCSPTTARSSLSQGPHVLPNMRSHNAPWWAEVGSWLNS
eukprot:TRINITY_DN2817_c0_g1_i2.p1 TRINITY_DN2817_c0_g1~~TRINITY_DN2817_c0_g1_i2.p1  ORF type:complete len:1425 (-),score=543.76 TRINITY_DN2817_c0_g1_i2:24-4298(-)